MGSSCFCNLVLLSSEQSFLVKEVT
uniref:Uncharacterized protein n=1 Tax=Rhizophora mucronata TaxID=61149 RepID=A0A2P2NQ37_RHIMU